jgi:type III pantothenate kinase
MKLLFDIGNTRIKWACDTGSALLQPGELVHRGLTPAQAVAWVADFEPAEEITEVWAVNVAGVALENSLAEALKARFGLALQIAKTTESCGAVVNGYTSIEQLGVDRWAAIVGAWEHFRTSACVVDVGTAVTIDMVAANGQHRGGIILPGLALMAESLNRDTSDIEGFAGNSRGIVPGDDWFGSDTLSAVQRGAVFALRSAICQAVEQTAEQDGAAPLVVLTGGDAEALLPLLSMAGDGAELMPMLVLEGLRYLAAESE